MARKSTKTNGIEKDNVIVNCVTKKILSERENALKCAQKRKKWEKGRKVTKIPHPTAPKCFIIKYE